MCRVNGLLDNRNSHAYAHRRRDMNVTFLDGYVSTCDVQGFQVPNEEEGNYAAGFNYDSWRAWAAPQDGN